MIIIRWDRNGVERRYQKAGAQLLPTLVRSFFVQWNGATPFSVARIFSAVVAETDRGRIFLPRRKVQKRSGRSKGNTEIISALNKH